MEAHSLDLTMTSRNSRDSPPLRTTSPSPYLKRTFSLPITQRAWRELRRGTPAESLELLKVPVMHNLAPGELLVKVEAAALNPVYVSFWYSQLL